MSTVTLHRLGLFSQLGVSLKTTNCVESLLSQVGQLTDRVDRWRTPDQKHRWVASALLAIEPRLRRIKGYRHLLQLQEALRREIQHDPVTDAQIAGPTRLRVTLDGRPIVHPGAHTAVVVSAAPPKTRVATGLGHVPHRRPLRNFN